VLRSALARAADATAARTEAAAADLAEELVAGTAPPAGATADRVGAPCGVGGAAVASEAAPAEGRSFFVDLFRERVARLTSLAAAGSGGGAGGTAGATASACGARGAGRGRTSSSCEDATGGGGPSASRSRRDGNSEEGSSGTGPDSDSECGGTGGHCGGGGVSGSWIGNARGGVVDANGSIGRASRCRGGVGGDAASYDCEVRGDGVASATCGTVGGGEGAASTACERRGDSGGAMTAWIARDGRGCASEGGSGAPPPGGAGDGGTASWVRDDRANGIGGAGDGIAGGGPGGIGGIGGDAATGDGVSRSMSPVVGANRSTGKVSAESEGSRMPDGRGDGERGDAGCGCCPAGSGCSVGSGRSDAGRAGDG